MEKYLKLFSHRTKCNERYHYKIQGKTWGEIEQKISALKYSTRHVLPLLDRKQANFEKKCVPILAYTHYISLILLAREDMRGSKRVHSCFNFYFNFTMTQSCSIWIWLKCEMYYMNVISKKKTT